MEVELLTKLMFFAIMLANERKQTRTKTRDAAI